MPCTLFSLGAQAAAPAAAAEWRAPPPWSPGQTRFRPLPPSLRPLSRRARTAQVCDDSLPECDVPVINDDFLCDDSACEEEGKGGEQPWWLEPQHRGRPGRQSRACRRRATEKQISRWRARCHDWLTETVDRLEEVPAGHARVVLAQTNAELQGSLRQWWHRGVPRTRADTAGAGRCHLAQDVEAAMMTRATAKQRRREAFAPTSPVCERAGSTRIDGV